MGKLGKLIVGIVVLLLILFAGLTAFVKYYLTDERIKEIVVPVAEKALGRQVSLGNISVGLFNGIVINDFIVKEAEGTADPDFINTGAFVFKYDLLPLLKKQVVIKEVLLDQATVRVTRDAQGEFNFASLAVLQKKEQPTEPAPEKTKEAGPPGALPVSLLVKSVRLQQAKLVVEDATGGIPPTQVTADLHLSLALGKDLSAPTYNGTIETAIEAIVGELQANTTLNGTLNEKDLDYEVNVGLAGDTVTISGQVKDYLTTPAVQLDITSQVLNLDKILAAMGNLPKGEKEEKPADTEQEETPAPSGPVGAPIPEGFSAQGTISIAKLAYSNLAMNSFELSYQLKDKIFTIDKAGANVAGGRMQSELTADLDKTDMDYSGRLGLKGVQAPEIIAATYKGASDFVSGAMDLGMTFDGAGTAWPALAKNMNAKGSFAFKEGGLKNTELTKTVAALVGLDELNDITFKELAGDLDIVKGETAIRVNMDGDDVSAKGQGNIGLNGSIDMPVELTLSKPLSEKLRKKSSVAKYLSNKDGQSTLRLKIAGSLSDPSPAFDSEAVMDQAKEAVTKKAFEELGKALSKDKDKEDDRQEKDQDPVQGILDGLFGN